MPTLFAVAASCALVAMACPVIFAVARAFVPADKDQPS